MSKRINPRCRTFTTVPGDDDVNTELERQTIMCASVDLPSPSSIGEIWCAYRRIVGSGVALRTAPFLLKDESGRVLLDAALKALDVEEAWCVGNTLEIRLPEPVPSNNKMLNWHYQTRNNYKKQCRRWVDKSLLRQHNKPRPPKGAFVYIRAIRYGIRKMDFDNLVPAFKWPIDALKHHGLIVDDSPEHILATYQQETAKRANIRTEIHLAWRDAT
jgi:Holliday junction resolvase RusA-like endonuclease